MWAAGSHEITRPPSGNWMMSSIVLTAAIMLWWVICTPLGGPVVPDV
jgi:hypothetical protein